MSNSNLEQLISAWLDGQISASESEALQQQLRQSSESRATFRKLTQLDAVIREIADTDQDVSITKRPITFATWSLAAAVVTIVTFVATLMFFQPNGEPKIAKITGLGGSLQWTGNGGQVIKDLVVGTQLPGGTVEGMAPDSWLELEFNDGSKIEISGNSMLTFSDHGQKVLRLKGGNVSSDIKPQPVGKPMLVHTRSAILEVMGTQFEVATRLASTTLNVSEGQVRMKRLSDGNSVDVSAGYRVTTSADREMSPVRVPESVHHWKSQLNLGSVGTYGTWLPASSQQAARLKGISYVPSENPTDILYMVGLAVSRSDHSPVILKPHSRFIVHGRLESPNGVYFGIRMAHPNGEFAGKFRADKPAPGLNDQHDFEVVFNLSDFELDPCVRDRKDELPSRPEGLIVTGVWCFTPCRAKDIANSITASLEVTEVELIPPADAELY